MLVYLSALVHVGFCVAAASEWARMLDLKQEKTNKQKLPQTPWLNSPVS